jgi:hypothetical protein
MDRQVWSLEIGIYLVLGAWILEFQIPSALPSVYCLLLSKSLTSLQRE